MPNEQNYQWATVAVLGIVLGFILYTYQDFGITWDEYVQHRYGQYVVDYYISMMQDTSVLSYKNLYLYGGFFDSIAVVLTKILPGDTYHIRHLFNAIVGFIGIIGALKLAHLLAGARAAFLAVLLLSVEPFYLGNMFNNPKDIPFAAAYIWSLYYMLSTFRYFPAIPKKLVIKLSIAIGIALAIRIGGLLLYGYLAVAIILYAFRPSIFVEPAGKTDRLDKWHWSLIKFVFLILVISQAIMLFFWPWAQQAPITRPLQAISAMSQFAWQGSVLFQGQHISAHDLPATYLVQHMIIKLSETIVLSIIVGAVMILWLLLKKRFNPSATTINLFGFVIFASVFPILYASLSNATLYDTIRHVLFVIPLFCVISAVVIDTLTGPPKKSGKRSAYSFFIIALLLVSPQLFANRALHPYEYVYYNQFAGGLKGAAGRYESDYWASSYRESVERLVDYLKRKDGTKFAERQYKIHVCAPEFPASYYFPDNFKLEKHIRNADYYISITRWNCHLKVHGDKVDAVTKSGVDLAVIKAVAK